MAQINMGATMQAIADRAVAAGIVTRAYGWPNEQASPPCLVVGYPDGDIEYDSTFRRGSDKATFPAWIVVGKAVERTTRDVLSAYIAGATGIKDALDGNLGGVVQTARVTDCQIEPVVIAGVEYLAARFDVEVYT